jgi:L-histidine N-alpha-methyltransferase
MDSLAHVAIHSSQFPDRVRQDLFSSLRARRINHKFHYDSIKQTQQWLALHQAYSPSRTDADCAAIYDRSFVEMARRFTGDEVHVLGLGCGGGQKDTRLVKLLMDSGKKVSYTPLDVSTAMVLVARQAALQVLGADCCFPLVCDLATATDLPAVLDNWPPALKPSSNRPARTSRLITFFGMMPNFEPEEILPRLAALLRRGEHLLCSANLAPGPDYAVGVRRILPLYDNALTRRWLMTFLLDLGMETTDGKLEFVIEEGTRGLMRIVTHFRFEAARSIQIDDEKFAFKKGESVRLFFSYRYTPARVQAGLNDHGLEVIHEWLAPSGEEGVFLVQRA